MRRLKAAYASVKVGNPLEPETLVGPLIDGAAFAAMQQALEAAAAGGGVVTGGARVTEGVPADAHYVRPALVEMPGQAGPVLKETFAPILYVMRYRELPDAIRLHNAVPRGYPLPSSRTICAKRSCSCPRGLRLRHRKRQYRPFGRGNRRRFRRGERDGRRTRIRIELVETLHAPRNEHHQLWLRAAARPGREVRGGFSSLYRSILRWSGIGV